MVDDSPLHNLLVDWHVCMLLGCCRCCFCHSLSQAITELNAYLAKGLSKDFDVISASVAKSNPQLATFLQGALHKSADQLRLLPGVMGYQQNDGECHQPPCTMPTVAWPWQLRPYCQSVH